MTIQEIIKKLVNSQRSMLDVIEGMTVHKFMNKLDGEPNPGEDIFGNRFTPLQMFMSKIQLGESDSINEGL